MPIELVGRQVRVLHLEDNETDQILVREMLAAESLDCRFVTVKTREDFEVALRHDGYDLILSDYTLPSYDGLSALSLARNVCPDVPFIFFSATIGEDAAIESLKKGATDYVLKQRPSRLVPAIRSALYNSAEHMRLRQAEEQLREHAALLDKARDAIILSDMELRVLFWNRGAERVYGWTAAEAMGKTLAELACNGELPVEMEEAVKEIGERGEWIGEVRESTREGDSVVVHCSITLIRDKAGQPRSLLIINTDITKHKQLEEQFLRTQRLESLGALVTGIAHDLNNTLSPIIAGIDILHGGPVTPENAAILQTMEICAQRSTDMVKQMLTFARGGETDKVLIRGGQFVREVAKIIGDTFPKSIHCTVKIGAETSYISCIPTQLHQVLINLCVNARDAMPNGGSLKLETGNVRVDGLVAGAYGNVIPGNYLYVEVSDTGAGIPAEQLDKIFQPFFTTKEPDKGTGLGLSTSLSIIENHGGFMTVVSEPGSGTEFKFYLPLADGAPAEVHEKVPLPAGSGECILVVDDEESVLAITRTTLENYGYRVMVTASAPEAVVRLVEESETIDLVIADLVMPFMEGHVTIRALRNIKPDIKVVVASGSESQMETAKQRIEADGFIAKPFTAEQLLTLVHQVLAR